MQSGAGGVSAFVAAFVGDLAAVLSISRGRIAVLSTAAGSIVVTFKIAEAALPSPSNAVTAERSVAAIRQYLSTTSPAALAQDFAVGTTVIKTLVPTSVTATVSFACCDGTIRTAAAECPMCSTGGGGGSDSAAIAAGVTVPLLVLLAALVALWYFRYYKKGRALCTKAAEEGPSAPTKVPWKTKPTSPKPTLPSRPNVKKVSVAQVPVVTIQDVSGDSSDSEVILQFATNDTDNDDGDSQVILQLADSDKDDDGVVDDGNAAAAAEPPSSRAHPLSANEPDDGGDNVIEVRFKITQDDDEEQSQNAPDYWGHNDIPGNPAATRFSYGGSDAFGAAASAGGHGGAGSRDEEDAPDYVFSN